MHPFTSGAVRSAVAWSCARVVALALKAAWTVRARCYPAGAGSLLLLLASGLAAPAAAQQFVTDDAAIVDYRACQLEAWHGQVESWVQPACQPIRNLEITVGIGFLANDGGRTIEYLLEGKTIFRELETNGFGWGLVAGVGVDPLAQVSGWPVAEIYAYLPASLSLADDRLILHGNLGWHFERGEHEHNGEVHEEAHHALTWAFRSDVLLAERLTLIGELFAEDRFLPEYQVGLRTTVVADRLLIDVTYGGHTAAGADGLGWVVGLTWTPPPFF